jgi:hypothetical protein
MSGYARYYVAGGELSRRLNPASFVLTMRSLSQARPFGGLHRASSGLSGAAVSPPVCIHRTLRPKGSSPACTSNGIFHPFHHHASWRTTLLSSFAVISHILVVASPHMPAMQFDRTPPPATAGGETDDACPLPLASCHMPRSSAMLLPSGRPLKRVDGGNTRGHRPLS